MTRFSRDPLYRRHRFPAQVIAHAVWLYFRFPLSLRMVEDMLAARGVIVSHQTVRLWGEKFGRHFANDIRKRSAGKLGDKWHLDEVAITIGGKKHWLWRTVDQDGFVLDVLVQSGRNAKAAKRLMRKLLKEARPFAACDDHRQASILRCGEAGDHARRRASPHKGLNNRAENSHQPVRRRERITKRFKSARHHPPRYSIHHHRQLRATAMQAWRQITCLHAE
ncbi:IS6 family transposase [Rhizobium lentis]|uniref:IS6 family transposase n=1 Tax=Rhizobium TaxID=379 RepID=UPI001C831AB4|nr:MULTISPECIES: IS6 family transposase [Rhizobium]MBX4893485.1 IS6 family transposase [Rhizobium bangladeshense]MBX4964087.1 IS6 family transposase [Rhizobium binae]MBX5014278.1 IS6 family transposase [Rhizobium lentis]MBX5020669.1 IS6 family transposase [Rhizobium lentis]MBX5087286.1 IS6 family transposase [Rhizobium lentis]